MHARSWLLAAMALTLPMACDDQPDPMGEPGATDGPPGPPAMGGMGDDGAEDTGGEDTGGEDTAGGNSEDYPPEVDDHLDLPWPPYDYDEALPAHFGSPAVRGMDNTPVDNPITDSGATLGRVLFYDRALSANQTISCSSCHAQANGFTDTATFSEGFEGGLTGRNSMSLANARFYAPGHFFWDERADTLEDQVLMPIQNEVEMGLTLEQLVQRVSAQPYYPELFARAFGDPGIDEQRISFALAQFVRAMVSYRSPWDEGVAAVGNPAADFPNFSAQENRGKDVFFGPGRCAVCHLGQDGPPPPPGAPLPNTAVFMLTEAANNGLDLALANDDNGVGDAFGDPGLNGVFKSPSLRNVALTAPYMHDGRFDTLRQVIDHYDGGVQDHPNLDPRLRLPGGGPPQRLNLTGADKDALEAFLRALTDEALVEDPRFADPFRD